MKRPTLKDINDYIEAFDNDGRLVEEIMTKRLVMEDPRWVDLAIANSSPFESVTIKVDLGNWKFIETIDHKLQLIHECIHEEDLRYPVIKITTFSAWHMKRCTFCDEDVPDDIHAILHTLIPTAKLNVG